jgi:hypothetical protein
MEDEPTAPIPPTEEGGPSTPGAASPPPTSNPPPPSWALPPPAAIAKTNLFTRVVGHRAAGWIVAALLVGAVTGLSVALANASSTPAARTTIHNPVAIRPPSGSRFPFGASGAFRRRAGGLDNAVVGRVNSVSASSFTVTTGSGTVVKIDEQSSTTYRVGANQGTKASVKTGEEVFVFGSRSGSMLKASRVIIAASGGGYFFPGG